MKWILVIPFILPLFASAQGRSSKATLRSLCFTMSGSGQDFIADIKCQQDNENLKTVKSQAMSVCRLGSDGLSYNGPSQNCVPCYKKAAELIGNSALKKEMEKCFLIKASKFTPICACLHRAIANNSSSPPQKKTKPAQKKRTEPKTVTPAPQPTPEEFEYTPATPNGSPVNGDEIPPTAFPPDYLAYPTTAPMPPAKLYWWQQKHYDLMPRTKTVPENTEIPLAPENQKGAQ